MNKIKITISVLGLCIFTIAEAQTSTYLGTNLSTVTLNQNDEVNVTYDLGPRAGLLFNLGSKKAKLQTGLGINQRGYRVEYEETKDETLHKTTGSLNAFYVSVPLKYKQYFGNVNKAFFTNIGLTTGIGVLANTRSTQTVGSESSTERDKVEFGEDLNRIDAGLNGSIGYRIEKIEIELGYYAGFVNAFASQSAVNGGNYNRSIELSCNWFIK